MDSNRKFAPCPSWCTTDHDNPVNAWGVIDGRWHNVVIAVWGEASMEITQFDSFTGKDSFGLFFGTDESLTADKAAGWAELMKLGASAVRGDITVEQAVAEATGMVAALSGQSLAMAS